MMCVEEHERLVGNGTSPSKDFTKQGVSARKQYVFVFTLAVCAAFAAGFFSSPNNTPLLFRSNSTSSSDNNAVAYADRVNDWDGLANANGAKHWDDTDLSDGPSPLFNASFVNYLTSGMKVMLARNNGTQKHYIYDSPYEKRWPGSKQPSWSRKTIPFNTHIESEKQICFVHVGKTGGSTVGCMLGFSLHCDSDNDIKGILPIVTTHALHRGINDCPEHAGYNLFVVRDPLARMLSTMNYERPNMTKPEPFSGKFHSKELYQDCDFWTLEDLARKGLRNTKRDSFSNMCRERAYSAMTGVGKYLVHGYFNYQYYTQFLFETEDNNGASTIPENAKILAIRNNHMVDDYNTINQLLGGQPNALKPSDIPVNNAHEKNATELYLSKNSKIALCQVLCNEIQVYKDILRQAINLNDADVLSSLDDLKGVCPKEAVENTCLEKRPKIRKKIEKRKGELNNN